MKEKIFEQCQKLFPHNGESKLRVRQQKPKQNISFGPCTEEGAKI